MATQEYRTVTTILGRNALQLALAQGTTIKLTHMAVGDGNGAAVTPLSTMTSLVHETYRAAINTLTVSPDTPDQLTAELIIPQSVGGFFIREVGIFLADGTLFAIGNTPLTEKTNIQSGSATDMSVKMVFRVQDANAIQLIIDPSQVLATRMYVDDAIQIHAEATHPALEAFRRSMIGVPRWWRSTTLPENHVWANGDLVLFEDWPELKEIYEAGGFEGMLLPAGSDGTTIAANLGKWVKHPNNLGLFTPNLCGQFFRAWGQALLNREAGNSATDTGRLLSGTVDLDICSYIWNATGVFSETGLTDGMNSQQGLTSEKQSAFKFDSASIWEEHSGIEFAPIHVYMPLIVYLGKKS